MGMDDATEPNAKKPRVNVLPQIPTESPPNWQQRARRQSMEELANDFYATLEQPDEELTGMVCISSSDEFSVINALVGGPLD